MNVRNDVHMHEIRSLKNMLHASSTILINPTCFDYIGLGRLPQVYAVVFGVG